MPDLENLGKVFETDVLVIGGGIAGLWTATRAKAFTDKVLIVDKGPQDWGGLCAMSGGDMIAVLHEEDVNDFVEELVYYYDGLCEQDLIEEILRQSHQRFQDYVALGHEFARGPDGKLKGIPQRGLKHFKCFVSRPYGKGGENMAGVLIKEAEKLGVKRIGRTLVTDLVKQKGAVCGAVGFHTTSGDFCIFRAKAVVITSGNGGWKTSYHMNTMTGEGIELALKAGAELRNCEFVKVWNVPKLFGWEGQTGLLPLGATFLNADGEPFMDKYSPALGANTDPHYNVMGMAIEAREGRGPFYFDCSGMMPEDIELMKPGAGWMKINYEKLLGVGMDFFGDRLEWMPQLMTAVGGVVADIKGQTCVPGLFAAGRVRNLDPGVYMGGWALCTTAVTGYMAGENAGKHAAESEPLPVKADLVHALKRGLFAPLGKKGIPGKEVLTKIQEAVFPYDVCILKNEKSLGKALDNIETIKKELLPEMVAADAHHLTKLMEVRSIATVTELVLRASLMRTESRAGHYREDYPDRDDENWLRWIIIKEDRGRLVFRTEPLPLEKYKFKPTRFYMDNFNFPKLH
ncbi:MAG: FAD-binding protein [Pseudomonadota bacterium]